MPCYLFTLHTYRSWMPDNLRGFVKKSEGVQPTNPALAESYRDAASDEPYEFDDLTQRFVVEVVRGIGARHRWRVHAIACEPTHIHLLVSWESGEAWSSVRGKFKNIISLELSKRHEQLGRRWLSTGASRKRVKDRTHFDYLMKTYLPRHGGACWCEGSVSEGG